MLLDTMYPDRVPAKAPATHMVEMMIAFLGVRSGTALDAETRAKLLARGAEGTEALVVALQELGLLPAVADTRRFTAFLRRYERGIARGNELLRRYAQQRLPLSTGGEPACAERLLLLRASRRHPAADPWFEADPSRWTVLGHAAETLSIEGDHYTMVQGAGAAEVAAILARRLASPPASQPGLA